MAGWGPGRGRGGACGGGGLKGTRRNPPQMGIGYSRIGTFSKEGRRDPANLGYIPIGEEYEPNRRQNTICERNPLYVTHRGGRN